MACVSDVSASCSSFWDSLNEQDIRKQRLLFPNNKEKNFENCSLLSHSTCLSAVPCCDMHFSSPIPEQPYSRCPHPCSVPAAYSRQDYHIHIEIKFRDLNWPSLNSGWSSSSLTFFASNSSGLWNLDYSPKFFSHTVLLFSSLYLLCQKPRTYLEEQYEGDSSHFVSLSSENTCHIYDLVIYSQWLHPVSGINGIRISLLNV